VRRTYGRWSRSQCQGGRSIGQCGPKKGSRDVRGGVSFPNKNGAHLFPKANAIPHEVIRIESSSPCEWAQMFAELGSASFLTLGIHFLLGDFKHSVMKWIVLNQKRGQHWGNGVCRCCPEAKVRTWFSRGHSIGRSASSTLQKSSSPLLPTGLLVARFG
jgi:hypothetical protein